MGKKPINENQVKDLTEDCKRQTTSRTSIKFERGFDVALVRFFEFENF